MESIEKWKDIPGYEGVYQVSNLGNVKSVSVNRFVHGVIMNIHRERTIRPFDNGHGYLVVSLNKNNTRKNYYVLYHFVHSLSLLLHHVIQKLLKHLKTSCLKP